MAQLHHVNQANWCPKKRQCKNSVKKKCSDVYFFIFCLSNRKNIVDTRNITRKIQGLEFFQAYGIVVFSILAVAIWGLISSVYFAKFQDPIWLRSLVCLFGVAVLFWGNRYKDYKRTPSLMIFFMALAMTFQSVYLAELNNWPVFYLIVTYIILTFTFMHITDRKIIYSWSGIFLGFSIYMSTFETSHLPNAYMLIISLTLIGISFISSIYREKIFLEYLDADEFSKKIFETMQEGLMIFDKQGRLGYFNSIAGTVLNFNQESFGKVTVQNILVPAYAENEITITNDMNPMLISQTQGLTFNQIEVKYSKSQNQNLWLIMNIVPLKEGDAQEETYSILVTFQDVTMLTENELIIKEQERMLSAKARFTALGEMASGIAHEINNPLAILMGRVSQIRRLIIGNSHEKQIQSLLDSIDQTIKRISRTISSMKTLSREGSGDPFEKTKLLPIIDDTMVLVKEKLERSGIIFSVEIDANIELECRPAQISQVLLNMLYNSKDAIENLPEKWIKISASDLGSSVALRVTDSGSGIPEDVRKKIMQPFFTTKEVGKGTGLGLSISTSIVRGHHGEISVDIQSKNTCFVMTLPKVQSASNKAA